MAEGRKDCRAVVGVFDVAYQVAASGVVTHWRGHRRLTLTVGLDVNDFIELEAPP